MNNSEIIRIVSPLALFIFHIIYLIVISKDPFLKKWIDGSFTFFMALVLCNIIRARIVAKHEQDAIDDAPDGDDAGPENNGTP